VQRLKNSLEEFKFYKSSGGTTSRRMQVRNRIHGAHRGKITQRLRPLRTGNSSKSGKKCVEAQEEQQQLSDRLEKEIWIVEDFTSRKA
jgi:hypothetical protein